MNDQNKGHLITPEMENRATQEYLRDYAKPIIPATNDQNNDQDDSVLVKIKPIRYHHEEVFYVPVFQKNFEDDGTPMYSPTFTYSMELATHDEQMAWSFEPDYVMVLRGTFDATTKPFLIKQNE